MTPGYIGHVDVHTEHTRTHAQAHAHTHDLML